MSVADDIKSCDNKLLFFFPGRTENGTLINLNYSIGVVPTRVFGVVCLPSCSVSCSVVVVPQLFCQFQSMQIFP